eukprot:gene7925-10150_t
MNKLTFEQIEKANRLANEIESKPTLNPHERIERNQISESEMLDMDEEALHSSVDRRASSHANHNNHPGNVGYSQDFRNSGSHRVAEESTWRRGEKLHRGGSGVGGPGGGGGKFASHMSSGHHQQPPG